MIRLGGTGLVVIGVLALTAVAGSASTNAGDLDTTFGDNGVALASISTYGAEAHAVVVQPDDKIVLAGWTRPPPPPPLPPLSPPKSPSAPAGEIGNKDFLALRLNADGSPDTDFGTDGFVRTPIDFVPGAANGANAVALGPDSSIVLAGTALDDLYTSDFAFVRYTSAGELDSTFSGDGIQTLDVGDEAFGVAVQPSDGKIVAVGRSAASSQSFTALRMNVDGTLDDSFGSGGVSRMNIGESFFDTPVAVALTPGGTILAAGTADDTAGHGDFALVRYLPNGQPDPAFGDGGVVITHDAANEHVHSLALAPDGKVLVSGVVEQAGWRLRVERYLPDGHLDATFGGTGIVTTTFGTSSFGGGVTVQADGKVVASVPVWVPPRHRFGLVRYTVDGAIDPTFGGGTRYYEFGTASATPYAVAIQDGGSPVSERIIEVGAHWDGSIGHMDMAAIRVLTGPPGQPPPPPPQPPPPPPQPPPILPPPPPAPEPVRCRVPRVVHLRLAKARLKIRRANCRVGRVRSVKARRYVGVVVSQSPRAGRRLQRGARVDLGVGRR